MQRMLNRFVQRKSQEGNWLTQVHLEGRPLSWQVCMFCGCAFIVCTSFVFTITYKNASRKYFDVHPDVNHTPTSPVNDVHIDG